MTRRLKTRPRKYHGVARSPHWRAIERQAKKAHPECAACGNRKLSELDEHHVQTFHEHPERELDLKNLITLCGDRAALTCHRLVGHGDDYHASNPSCRRDARRQRRMIAGRQYAKAEGGRRKGEGTTKTRRHQAQ